MYPLIEKSTRDQYALLGFDKENLVDAKCIDMTKTKRNPVVSRALLNSEDSLVRWAKENNGKGNCFIGRNPRDNRENVTKISALTLDLDPIREKNKPATEEQTMECLNAGELILETFRGGSMGFSGNGVLLLWTTNQPITTDFKAFEKKLKAFQDECSSLIKKPFNGVRIDATQDSKRLIKLMGTVSVKGPITTTKFIHLSGGRGDGNAVFEHVKNKLSLDVEPKDTSRSGFDWAFVLDCAKKGINPERCLELVKNNPLGRNGNTKDHIRCIEKAYQVQWNGETFVGEWKGGKKQQVEVVLHSPKNSLDQYIATLEKRGDYDKPELQTGIQQMDEATCGLRRGELYTVAARPAVGKSAYLLNIAHRLCFVGKRVLMLSTEMSRNNVYDRILSLISTIDGQSFSRGKFTEDEKKMLLQAYKTFRGFDFHVCDAFEPDILSVSSAVEKIKPDVVMFDHIQHTAMGAQNEVRALSDFTRGLKSLAMAKDIAVVVSSQLKRPLQGMDFKTGSVKTSPPTINDLKGCGTIEEESAFVLLMQPSHHEDPTTAVVNVELAKNRFGPTAMAALQFNQPISKFIEF